MCKDVFECLCTCGSAGIVCAVGAFIHLCECRRVFMCVWVHVWTEREMSGGKVLKSDSAVTRR